MPAIHVEPVTTERGRRRFVKFPWRVYEDDANWVPPVIPEGMEYLDPERGLFFPLLTMRQGAESQAAGTGTSTDGKAGTDITGTQNGDPISFEAFRDIVATELQVEKGKVVPEASFVEDLLADSIQLVEMMLGMEEAGITIPVEFAWEIETVGDAYQLYREHATGS